LLCCCCSWDISQNTAFSTNFTMLSAAQHIVPLHVAFPGSLARQPCPAALPVSLARQPCPAALPGSLARQPCPAALPGSLTEILQAYLSLGNPKKALISGVHRFF
jgi:hypothetical protein